MRSFIGILCCALFATPTWAQHKQSHNYSVFSGFNHLPPNTNVVPANFPKEMEGWVSHRDRFTGMHRDLYGPAIEVPGKTIAEKAKYCVEVLLPQLGVPEANWKLELTNDAPHASYAQFYQYIDGHQVGFARLSLRFTTDGKLVRIRNYYFGSEPKFAQPNIAAAAALAKATENLPGFQIETQHAEDWIWFPVPGEYGYELTPAWPFTVSGVNDGQESYLNGYVNAINGQLLYRDDEVKDNVDLKVTGKIYPLTPSDPPVELPLTHLRVTVGGGGFGGGTNYFTDTAGFLEIGNLNPPTNTTIALRGRYARVRDAQNNDITPSFQHTISSNGGTYLFPETNPSAARFVNAYYHVNKVHDYMKGHLSNFTGLDNTLSVYVDVQGYCNAFYSGGSNTLNFYQEGSGCNSFAMCSDIIYHEYGHAIAQNFYTWQAGSRMRNGALNEGHADIWALGITENPVLGSGAYAGGNGYIRRYDSDPKVYPQHIRGEVHADGEIIAGAWWTLADMLGDVQKMMEIFTKTWYDTPDGPNGMEGVVYHDVLISALLNDDDDNDLSNGTPNIEVILNAFARHGIYLLANAVVAHEEVTHPDAAASVNLTAEVQLPPDNLPLFKELSLAYRVRTGDTAWTRVSMTRSSSNNMLFTGTIPGQPAGAIVDYHFALHDYRGIVNSYAPTDFDPNLPETQSTIPYQYGVGIGSVHRFNFDEPLIGWQVGNVAGDNATSGVWEQAVPVGSFANSVMGQLQVQPDNDRSVGASEGKCLVTANPPAGTNPTNVNAADVDNGITSVVTPVFDLSDFDQPIISYYRWFSNNRGTNARTDAWQVQMRAGGAPTWFHSVEHTFQADHNWRRRIFSVKEYLPNATSVQLKFIASDRIIGSLPNQGQGTVEAAIDDLFIYDLGEETSVDEMKIKNLISVYPNPSDEHVDIIWSEPLASGIITLYDVTGRQITQTDINSGTNKHRFSTKQFAAGQYFIVVQSGKKIWSRQISVQH